MTQEAERPETDASAGSAGDPAVDPGSESGGTAPWRDVEAWRTPEIPAEDSASLRGTWILAGVWTLLTGSVLWLLPGALEQSPRLGWLVLLFPLSAVGVLIHAAVETWRWRRHGRVVFEMDPHPGSLGGEVAGALEHPGRHRSGDRYRAVLNCVHERMRRRGSGIHDDHLRSGIRSDVSWQAEGYARAGPGPGGTTRLAVRFEVPAGLPESERAFDDDRRRHRWELYVEGEGRTEGFERRFELPVFDTGGETSERWSDLTLTTEHGPEGDATWPEETVVVREAGEDVGFHCPRGRRRSLGRIRLGAGAAVLTFPPALVTVVPGLSPPLIPAVAGGLMVAVVGSCLAGSGVWHLLNELHVSVTPERIRAVREIAGVRVFEKTVPTDAVANLAPVPVGSGSGRGRERPYRIELRARGGGRMVVGDGLEGERLARRVCERMREAAGL